MRAVQRKTRSLCAVKRARSDYYDVEIRRRLEKGYEEMKGMSNNEKQDFVLWLSSELKLNTRQIRMWMKNRKKRGEYKGKNQYSLEAVEILESYFRCREYPTKEEKKRLAEELHIAESRIKKWFQTRRERGSPASVTDRIVAFAPPVGVLSLLGKYLECDSLSLLENRLAMCKVMLKKDSSLLQSKNKTLDLNFAANEKTYNFPAMLQNHCFDRTNVGVNTIDLIPNDKENEGPFANTSSLSDPIVSVEEESNVIESDAEDEFCDNGHLPMLVEDEDKNIHRLYSMSSDLSECLLDVDCVCPSQGHGDRHPMRYEEGRHFEESLLSFFQLFPPFATWIHPSQFNVAPSFLLDQSIAKLPSLNSNDEDDEIFLSLIP